MLTSVSDLWKLHIINELKFCSSACKKYNLLSIRGEKREYWKIPVLSLTDFGIKSQVQENTHTNLIPGSMFSSPLRSPQENTEPDPWEGGLVFTEIKIFHS